MNHEVLDRRHGEAAVVGGALLGGGGGGSLAMGRELVELALRVGQPRLLTIDDVLPDSVVLTVALVGAPASPGALVEPVHYVRAVELGLQALGLDRHELGGLITNENGATATVNGWFQSAILGVPVVDAPCNGRAHPTGLMGAMGLERVDDYTALQSAAGGGPGTYVEVTVRGSLARCASVVRATAVEAGGLVAVARNPVKAHWAAANGAPGAIGQAIQLGLVMMNARPNGLDVAHQAATFLGGQVVGVGVVEDVQLVTSGGFDVGRVRIVDRRGEPLELTFWNEFMTCERRGQPMATFPDLIALVGLQGGEALTTAELRPGTTAAIVVADRSRLRLGAGMRSSALMEQAERAVGKRLL